MENKRCVLLLSGGLDSATCAAVARKEGYEIHALSFRYGQRHVGELECAKKIANYFSVASVREAEIDLRAFGGSALTDEIEVPKNRTEYEMGIGIPSTYVPARNTIFLSFALGLAEVLHTGDIFIGVNALDYSGYPDCRPEFISRFERMANVATKGSVLGDFKVQIHAPLLNLSKAEIIKLGISLGVDYSLTSSCYDPTDGKACGECDACLLRLSGFRSAGIEDPIEYVGGSR